MATNQKIHHLTEFIDYDSETSKFIVRSHSIEVPYTEIQLKDVKNKKTRKIGPSPSKEVMGKLCGENGKCEFKSHKDHNPGKNRGKTIKNGIESLLLRRIWVYKDVDFIEVTDNFVLLKWTKNDIKSS